MSENIDGNSEELYILDKKINCPVCNKEFVTKQVKTGKARFIGTDDDLRPKYVGIDTIKYDVILCPHCGYAAMSREFNNVTSRQRQKLKEDIADKFEGIETPEGIYSYLTAIHRCKMALLTSIVKPAKLSESSYICLKLAWLYRGAVEELSAMDGDHEQKISEFQKNEEQYIKEAYQGFVEALQKEYPPICNMDEMTLNYLVSVLAYQCGDVENSQRYAYAILGARSASAKLKEKARAHMEKLRSAAENE
jgi:uncharacterized protein (DUF2225 family)